MVTVAVPVADVVTGGTSFEPVSVTVWVCIESDIVVQPATMPIAPASASADIRTRRCNDGLLMSMPPSGTVHRAAPRAAACDSGRKIALVTTIGVRFRRADQPNLRWAARRRALRNKAVLLDVTSKFRAPGTTGQSPGLDAVGIDHLCPAGDVRESGPQPCGAGHFGAGAIIRLW